VTTGNTTLQTYVFRGLTGLIFVGPIPNSSTPKKENTVENHNSSTTRDTWSAQAQALELVLAEIDSNQIARQSGGSSIKRFLLSNKGEWFVLIAGIATIFAMVVPIVTEAKEAIMPVLLIGCFPAWLVVRLDRWRSNSRIDRLCLEPLTNAEILSICAVSSSVKARIAARISDGSLTYIIDIERDITFLNNHYGTAEAERQTLEAQSLAVNASNKD
jgi:hypothetical protein